MSKLNNNKVRFAEILVASGLNADKVLNAIGFPTCIGFVWQGAPSEGNTFVRKPDDDYRIAFWNPEHSKGEGVFDGADQKRNVGMYDRAFYQYDEKNNKRWGEGGILTIGRCEIRVYTFDGYASNWKSVPWRIDFIYSDGSSNSSLGGDSRGGLSSKPLPSPIPAGYFDARPAWFFDYYENGKTLIPPAREWRMPRFLVKN